MTGVRFVALGDSITVGLGDPMPDRTWRGWAALLAEGLAPPSELEFHNVAELGATASDLAQRQLPAALRLRPTVAAVVVGVNDTLRRSFDVGVIGRSMSHTVSTLRGCGAIVLTARLPDPGRMFGLPRSLARPLTRRTNAINAVNDMIAARYHTVHFDAANHPDTYHRHMWSVDRLHPSERGHRQIASSYADLLAARAFPVYRAPRREPTNPPPSQAAQLMWMATKGTKWVFDRSTDLVPYLIAMAGTEWWYQVRGIAVQVDERLGVEVARVLAQLDGVQPVALPGVPASAG